MNTMLENTAENTAEKKATAAIEAVFARAQKLMEMEEKILLSRHKVNFCRRAMEELERLDASWQRPEGEEDSDEAEEKASESFRPLTEEEEARRKAMMAELQARMDNATAGISIEIYTQASTMRNNAKNADEMNSAAARFQEAEESLKANPVREETLSPEVAIKYEEAKQAAAQTQVCRKESRSLFGKKRILNLAVILAVLILAGGMLIGFRTSTFRMALGKVQLSMGLNDAAAANFEKAYKRHKSDKTYALYIKGLYAQGMASYEDGDFASAAQELYLPSMEEGYEDAAAACTNAELALLREAQVGDKVDFGNRSWYVLEQQGDKVLLLKLDGVGPRNYLEEGTAGKVWADSCLREYLNGEYIDTNFNMAEQECLIETTLTNPDNPVYGTEGGPDTTDRVFLMSTEEYDQYYDLINKCGHCCWLRTPGKEEGTVTFVDVEKVVMDYGYPGTAETMYFKPVMWVDTTKAFE